MKKEIRIYLDQEVYEPGETVRGRIELHWPRKKKVRGIHMRLMGNEETAILVSRGAWKTHTTTTYREVNRIIGREIRLWGGKRVGWMKAMGEGLARPFKKLVYPELSAGRHRFPFKFRLPSRALPSYDGTYVTIKYKIGV